MFVSKQPALPNEERKNKSTQENTIFITKNINRYKYSENFKENLRNLIRKKDQNEIQRSQIYTVSIILSS
jgi:hypothetical protein